MTKNTHNTGGLLFSLIPIDLLIKIYISIYSLPYIALLLSIYFYFVILGSAFPDIDLKSSNISKRYPLIWRLCGKKYRHRSFTHSILALLILGTLLFALIIISMFNEIIIVASIGLFIGYMSHIILDLLNPQGVELFYPCKFNVKLLNIKTNGPLEGILNHFLRALIIIATSTLIINYVSKFT